MLLLVTSSQAVSGYLTLQRHPVVLLTLYAETWVGSWQEAQGRFCVSLNPFKVFFWGGGLEFSDMYLVFAPAKNFPGAGADFS